MRKEKDKKKEALDRQMPVAYDIPDFDQDQQEATEKPQKAGGRKATLIIMGAIAAILVLLTLIVIISYKINSKPASEIATGTSVSDTDDVMMEAQNTVPRTTTAPKSKTTTTTTETTTTDIPVIDETETETVAISDNDDGSQLLNLGYCSMVIPETWVDRYVVRENTVYSKECWKKKKETGMLFTVEIVDAVEPCEDWLLGTCESGFVMLRKPQDTSFSVSNEKLVEECADMQLAVDDIAKTAVCSTTPYEYNPLCLADFEDPADRGIYGAGVDPIFETWMLDLSTWAETSIYAYDMGPIKPVLSFNMDGSLQYDYFSTYWGNYLINVGQNSDVYALAFFAGQVHQISMQQDQLKMDGMDSIIDALSYMNTTEWTFRQKAVLEEEEAAATTTAPEGEEGATETTTTETVADPWSEGTGWDNGYGYDYNYDYNYGYGY